MKWLERGLDSEFHFQTARSGGKGGQHVNKVETKVELYFHIQNSQLLDDTEKTILLHKLQNKLNQEGFVILSSQKSRSQLANKEDAVKKFFALLEKAFQKPKLRKPTRVPAAVVAKRLETKKHRSEVKKNRRLPDS
ncbi:MAG: aminoacyl-tRNA hydrolase [Bacteroidia bacterium]|nr:aminoacyl-tRNA hydrolase [Bacteroidia bacterium]